LVATSINKLAVLHLALNLKMVVAVLLLLLVAVMM